MKFQTGILNNTALDQIEMINTGYFFAKIAVSEEKKCRTNRYLCQMEFAPIFLDCKSYNYPSFKKACKYAQVIITNFPPTKY